MNKKTIIVLAAILGIGALIAIGYTIKEEKTIYPEDLLRPYAGFEEAKKAFKGRDIYIPTHLPAQLSWPPSEVRVQRKPFPAIIMVFKKPGGNEPVLELIQYRSGERFDDQTSIKLTTIRQRGPFKMRGIDSLFTFGECGAKEPCGTATWEENGFAFIAALRGAPYELSKVVASMKR